MPDTATRVVRETAPALAACLAQFYHAGHVIPPASFKLGDYTAMEEWAPPRAEEESEDESEEDE